MPEPTGLGTPDSDEFGEVHFKYHGSEDPKPVSWPAATMASVVVISVITGVVLVCSTCAGLFSQWTMK
jgi:hypothetical protein